MKVGTRVRVVKNDAMHDLVGLTGMIAYFDGSTFLVELDKYNRIFHSGMGRVKVGHGWWFNAPCIEPIITDDSVSVKITTKKNMVIATLFINGIYHKHAVARCHPDDEFDLLLGTKIALGRLGEI